MCALKLPATVISSTLQDTLGWPDATIVGGDAVDIVTRLKQESPVPLRSQASLSLNWALLAAGLIDRVQVTVFPVITGRTGTNPILRGAGDHDLESEVVSGATGSGRAVLADRCETGTPGPRYVLGDRGR